MSRGMPPARDEEVHSEVVTAAAKDGAEGDRDKATSRFDSMSWYGQRQRVPMLHAWASVDGGSPWCGWWRGRSTARGLGRRDEDDATKLGTTSMKQVPEVVGGWRRGGGWRQSMSALARCRGRRRGEVGMVDAAVGEGARGRSGG